MNKKILIVISGLILVVTFIVGGSIYKNAQSDKLGFMAKENASVFVRPHSMAYGNENAKTVIVEFFDPACETCKDFHPFVKTLMKENEGKIRLVLRYAPYHSNSEYVVKMLEGARLQGKYDEMLGLLFKYQDKWASHTAPANIGFIWSVVSEIGLDVSKLQEDIKKDEISKIVMQDLQDAQTLGATKTPAFFVNGKPLQSFGYTQLRKLVESQL
ncbi:MAG: thioredoxin domain-containing protein [Sulfurospirillaceae bacterium]|nr:thioredoxin domain-containing protein [Sulfurospirillaceae bacterium]MDD3463360.1 thioredoxin domain-containing protein [Sulfurospirillaceae bacterium]